MKKILLIDNNEIYIYGLKILLSEYNNIKILHVCSSGEDALIFLEKNSSNVDVVLIDINMKKVVEIDVAKRIKSKYPNIKLIINSVYSGHICEEIRKETGANGYTCKLEEFNDFLDVVLK